MPETEGSKRLEPRMTRGSFRFTYWAVIVQIFLSVILMLLNVGILPGREWEPVAFFLAAALFLVNLIFLGRLLRVRRNDTHFWNEEEARREEWDRRGRQL
ncbi:hypothetical protein AHiyo1_48700 [Arthrobacter sp. Hiyo1]|uniref:hypothetical protein n=1 Tax=Arthrobacter sp. Hiyo1 TaxID=1588020 RepID=UPI0006A33820|nr:hypothetical protein [Arthrobacter sp. Hiyo1]GAP61198.1 hypothetical protein AHiyo1_48700 [Arthrobacter sp. Hiyo1]